ncbi:hypothetical protein AVDCRST_MAG94-5029 [uncultured Leptolyngbya sp.]|uniref:Uncharacterized protein n=1 Tax=uncultured Leptolyngbya sp. TaxID=332963 RepID=A0A6J4NFK0_9CYAN|nr:hypothetical protein AVDCRST_MAG94-5029 [uncultured Leptolyngbya sp.]
MPYCLTFSLGSDSQAHSQPQSKEFELLLITPDFGVTRVL